MSRRTCGMDGLVWVKSDAGFESVGVYDFHTHTRYVVRLKHGWQAGILEVTTGSGLKFEVDGELFAKGQFVRRYIAVVTLP